MLDSGDMPIGTLVATTAKSPAIKQAYDAPFPDKRFKAGPLMMPQLVPIGPDDPATAANKHAWEVLRQWQKPFLTAFGDSDPITGGAEKSFQQAVPGARTSPTPRSKVPVIFCKKHTPTNWPRSSPSLWPTIRPAAKAAGIAPAVPPAALGAFHVRGNRCLDAVFSGHCLCDATRGAAISGDDRRGRTTGHSRAGVEARDAGVGILSDRGTQSSPRRRRLPNRQPHQACPNKRPHPLGWPMHKAPGA